MKKLIEIDYGFRKIKIPAYTKGVWAVHRHLGKGDWVVTHLPSQRCLPHFFPTKLTAFVAANLARRIFSNVHPDNAYLIANRWFDEMAEAGFRFNPPVWELAS